MEKNDTKVDPKLLGIKGWLAFFSISLLVSSSFSFLINVGLIIDYETLQNPYLLCEKLLLLLISAFGIYAGILLVSLHSKAVVVVKKYLYTRIMISLISLIGLFSTRLLESTLERSDFFLESLIIQNFTEIIILSIWLLYFIKSKRVANTFSPEGISLLSRKKFIPTLMLKPETSLYNISLYCANCGSEIQPDDKICPHCQVLLDHEIQTLFNVSKDEKYTRNQNNDNKT
ncbi:MAG: zinc ribbon domain-containing protein [Endomicrobia bacterium]|nr:zinc ribbon domain-containing protein [Endomicrobiia bacterium]